MSRAYRDHGRPRFPAAVHAGVRLQDPARAGPSRHRLRLNLPIKSRQAFVRRSGVDEEYGNARTAWQAMGSPRSPDAHQLAVLHEAAEPVRRHQRLPVEGGAVDLDLSLQRHEITLVEVAPVEDESPPWADERRLLGGQPR